MTDEATAAEPALTLDHATDVAGKQGTGEREFRPDIQGLRAVAVTLVVIYHAKIKGINSGYVGVDVFFVISGYLITGLLVRERLRVGTTSIVRFYARRVRRILPASTLVVVATIFASYHWLGFVSADIYSVDAKWTAIFAANIRFGELQTTYLGAQAAPSPFQQMWSLGVEEQFYVVWPTLFALVAIAGSRRWLRPRLILILAVITACSFAWSIIQTVDDPKWAYFSPLTRAWELSLGGLVAVCGSFLCNVPKRVANLTGVLGLITVIVSAFVYSDGTSYPGYAVALPVAGSAIVLASGVAHRGLNEILLGSKPFQWLGSRSYSLYLWHWPFLIIPAEEAGHSLSVGTNLLWVGAAVIASELTYRFIENPIRFAKPLTSRPKTSVALGLALIALTVAVAQWQIATHYGTWNPFA